MPQVRVEGFRVSLDGFSGGIDQSLIDPLGKRGIEIAQWLFHTKPFYSMHGRDGDLSIWTMIWPGGRRFLIGSSIKSDLMTLTLS
jgi:hypothetical protein